MNDGGTSKKTKPRAAGLRAKRQPCSRSGSRRLEEVEEHVALGSRRTSRRALVRRVLYVQVIRGAWLHQEDIRALGAARLQRIAERRTGRNVVLDVPARRSARKREVAGSCRNLRVSRERTTSPFGHRNPPGRVRCRAGGRREPDNERVIRPKASVIRRKNARRRIGALPWQIDVDRLREAGTRCRELAATLRWRSDNRARRYGDCHRGARQA